MKIDRKLFLEAVEAVLPGVAGVEDAEQTSCIAFVNNRLFTYNDEVACSVDFKIDFTGAVQAKLLLGMLRRLRTDEIEVKTKTGEFVIHSKGKKAGITMEKEIVLPLDSIKPPKKWTKLDADFIKAINLVNHCVSTDDSQFVLTCVHVAAGYVEAMDNFQLSRYKIKTDLKKSMLIRGDSLRSISSAKVTEFGETKTWAHFRNDDGLLISCRRHKDDFPNITSLLKVNGSKAKLPKSIREAVELAALCSVDNDVSDMIQVTLDKNKIVVRGEGETGWFEEKKKTEYNGKKIVFKIPPKLLISLIQKQTDSIVTKDRLKIRVGKMTYVTVLSVVE